MGAIRETVSLTGTISSVDLLAFFDTGSDYNVIRPRLSNGMTIDELGVVEYLEPVSLVLPGEDESALDERRTVESYDFALFKWIDILGKRIYEPAFVLMEIGDDMLVGHGIMQRIGIGLDLKYHRLILQM